MVVSTLEEALAVRSQVAEAIRVETLDDAAREWDYVGGRVVNTRTGYFEIIGRRSPHGEHLLIRQSEPALVGLVVTGPPSKRRLLLNARAEPGLVGLCQFSTTVQSTPSNYEQRHGGRATPLLDAVLHPSPDSRVLVDVAQYDWGQYYHRKTKRMVIVELPDEVPVSSPLHWVDDRVLDQMLAGDHLVTTDLRVAATTLGLLDAGVAPRTDAPAEEPDAIGFADLALQAGTASTVRADGVSPLDDTRQIVWVRTTATTREVDQWEQPLLAIRDDLDARLAVRRGRAGLEVAVVEETQVGLDGIRLLHPAPVVGGTVIRRCENSAEGGRFLRHIIRLALVADAEPTSGSWMPLSEAGSIALAPLGSSVELRLLLGLALLPPPVMT